MAIDRVVIIARSRRVGSERDELTTEYVTTWPAAIAYARSVLGTEWSLPVQVAYDAIQFEDEDGVLWEIYERRVKAQFEFIID